MKENYFIPSDLAYKMKLLGFDEPCVAFWDFYNGGSHFNFKPYLKSRFIIKLISLIKGDKEESISDYSQYYLEYVIGGGTCCLAPTYEQAFNWFSDIKNKYTIDCWVEPYLSTTAKMYQGFYCVKGEKISVGVFNVREECQNVLLSEIIKIKNKL